MIKKKKNRTKRKIEMKEHILQQKEVYKNELDKKIQEEKELLAKEEKSLSKMESNLVDVEYGVETLEKELREVQAKRESLKNKIKKRELKIKEQILKLREEKESILIKMEQYDSLSPFSEKGLEEERKNIILLKETVEALKVEESKKEKIVLKLIEEGKQVSNKMGSLTNELKSLTLNKQILDQKEKDLHFYMGKSTKKIKKQKEEVRYLKGTINVLNERLDKGSDLLNKAQEKIEKAEIENTQLREELKVYQTQDQFLLESIKRMQTDIKAGEVLHKTLMDEASILEPNVYAKEKELAELNYNLSKNLEASEKTQVKLTELELRNKTLETQLVEVKNKIEKSISDQKEMNQRVEILTININSSEIAFEKYQETYNMESKQVEKIDSSIKVLETENQNIRKKVELIQSKVEKVKTQKEEAKTRKKELLDQRKAFEQKERRLNLDLKRIVDSASEMIHKDKPISFKKLRSYIQDSINFDEKAVEAIRKDKGSSDQLKKIFQTIINNEVYCKSVTLIEESMGSYSLSIVEPFESINTIAELLEESGINTVETKENSLEIAFNINSLGAQQNFPL